jgi:hypothetical protein
MVLPWRALVAAAVLSLALGAALYERLAGGLAPVAPAVVRTHDFSQVGLSNLPLAAQGPVSDTLGAVSAAYRVSPDRGGFRASNPAQHLTSSFTRSGVSVRSGATQVALSLRGIGYGSSLTVLGTVAPSAHANRVLYAPSGLSEWYTNGPLGLEQGFTVARAPAGHAVGPLTISIALSGNAQASLTQSGQSITLSRAGESALRYSGLRATDARGHLLHSWLALEGRRLLLRVDARDARYPLRIDPLLQEGAKLTGAGASGQPHFGDSVALSADGSTALIGGYKDNGEVGAAWVFTRSGATWIQQGSKLTGSGESGKGRFGESVALSGEGNTALVGGDYDNGEVGAAWVFTRSGSTWTQQGSKLTGSEEIGKGRFGERVAMSDDGNTALIGGYEDNGGVGAAWVFTRSGSTWTQQGSKLSGSEVIGKGRFGGSVALSESGDTALIGGYNDSFGAGAVWVFTRSGSTWTQQGSKLTGSEESEEAAFAGSVALSDDGNIALIGAPLNNNEVGASWVFTRSGSTWTQQGSKLTGSGESGKGQFGDSVALSGEGTTALIGGNSDAREAGAAWVFTRSAETWTQQGSKLTGGEEIEGGEFGASVALSGEGSYALIGGPFDNAGNGAAWAFTTGAIAPAVVTGEATSLTPTSATLNATVNPDGQTVSVCEFEYGLTPSYGKTELCSSGPGSGTSPVAVSAPISGLEAGTTYHFRVSATSTGGTTVGADETLETPEAPPPPKIKKLSPKKGPAAGKTSVTITGTKLGGATAVKFGSTEAISFTVNSETSITALSPPGTTGAAEVSVTTPSGNTASTPADRFTYETPTITMISTNTGPQGGGTPVIVTGSGFALSGTTFKFGKVPASSVICGSTIECTVGSPAATKAGTVDITVTVSKKTSKKSSADRFTYE